MQSLVALLQRPAYLRHVHQGDEPAHVGKLGEGLAQHEQAAPFRIVPFALGGNLPGQELIGAQQRLQGVGILQVVQHLEDGFALQRRLRLKRAQPHMALGSDIGQEDAALRITDKVRCWQLLQAVAHKLVQIPQLARGGFHRVDAPFQEVAAPCPWAIAHGQAFAAQMFHFRAQKMGGSAEPAPAPQGVGQHQAQQCCGRGKVPPRPAHERHRHQQSAKAQPKAGEQGRQRPGKQQSEQGDCHGQQVECNVGRCRRGFEADAGQMAVKDMSHDFHPWHQARTTADGGGKGVPQAGCHSPDQHIFALECVGRYLPPQYIDVGVGGVVARPSCVGDQLGLPLSPMGRSDWRAIGWG